MFQRVAYEHHFGVKKHKGIIYIYMGELRFLKAYGMSHNDLSILLFGKDSVQLFESKF